MPTIKQLRRFGHDDGGKVGAGHMKTKLPDRVTLLFEENIESNKYTFIYTEQFLVNPDNDMVNSADKVKKLVKRTAAVAQMAMPDLDVRHGEDWISLGSESIEMARVGDLMASEFMTWGSFGDTSLRELFAKFAVTSAENKFLRDTSFCEHGHKLSSEDQCIDCIAGNT